MRVVPYQCCTSCRAVFEIEAGDVRKKMGFRYDVACPVCTNLLTIQSRVYAKLFPQPEVPASVPEPKKNPQSDEERKKIVLAREAYAVRCKSKTDAIAARALGITASELRERMSHLPPDEVSVGSTAGVEVPAGMKQGA